MTGMRAARARARAGAGCALARSRGRGGGPAVRSRVRGDAGPGLRRSLPPGGLGASSFPLRPGALGSLPPPTPPSPPAAPPRVGLRASVPRGAPGALGNSAPSRALRGGPRPRAPAPSTAPDRSPLSPHALPPSLPCRPAKPLPISPRPCPKMLEGPVLLRLHGAANRPRRGSPRPGPPSVYFGHVGRAGGQSRLAQRSCVLEPPLVTRKKSVCSF